MPAATLGSVQLRVIQVRGEPTERRQRGWSRCDGGNPSDSKSLRRSPNSDSPPVTVVRLHDLSARPQPATLGRQMRCWCCGGKRRRVRSVYLHCIPTVVQAAKRETERSERGREGGRRGLMLLLGKNDAAAVLGGCRQTERERGVWGARGCGRRGEERRREG